MLVTVIKYYNSHGRVGWNTILPCQKWNSSIQRIITLSPMFFEPLNSFPLSVLALSQPKVTTAGSWTLKYCFYCYFRRKTSSTEFLSLLNSFPLSIFTLPQPKVSTEGHDLENSVFIAICVPRKRNERV